MAGIAVALNPRNPDFPGILHKASEGTRIFPFLDNRRRKNPEYPLLGLLCSIRCPGRVIVQTYDLARALRDAGLPVIAGFDSPMEKECLDFSLHGKQPGVVCPCWH